MPIILTPVDLSRCHNKKCTTTNPVDVTPFSFEGEPHECVAEAMRYTKLRPDLESTPLLNADVTYNVASLCYKDHLGNHVGFAIVKQDNKSFSQ